MITPLAGRRVIVTRARLQSGDFIDRLAGAGAEVLEMPTIELVPPSDWSAVDAAISRLSSYDLVIFTSANGVERFLERLDRFEGALERLQALPSLAIGPATAAALERRGLPVTGVPSEYRAEAVLPIARGLLGAEGPEPPRVLIPRAQEAREVLPEGLRESGAVVDVVPVYRTVVPAGVAERLRLALEAGVDCVTFTSSSTVRNFARMAGPAGLARLQADVAIACIGPITAETARRHGLEVQIQPDDYTIDALFDAIVAFYS